jgi:hypothetical protein
MPAHVRASVCMWGGVIRLPGAVWLGWPTDLGSTRQMSASGRSEELWARVVLGLERLLGRQCFQLLSPGSCGAVQPGGVSTCCVLFFILDRKEGGSTHRGASLVPRNGRRSTPAAASHCWVRRPIISAPHPQQLPGQPTCTKKQGNRTPCPGCALTPTRGARALRRRCPAAAPCCVASNVAQAPSH